jgi:hypothetical protein
MPDQNEMPGRGNRKVFRHPFHETEQRGYEMAHAITEGRLLSRSVPAAETSSSVRALRPLQVVPETTRTPSSHRNSGSLSVLSVSCGRQRQGGRWANSRFPYVGECFEDPTYDFAGGGNACPQAGALRLRRDPRAERRIQVDPSLGPRAGERNYNVTCHRTPSVRTRDRSISPLPAPPPRTTARSCTFLERPATEVCHFTVTNTLFTCDSTPMAAGKSVGHGKSLSCTIVDLAMRPASCRNFRNLRPEIPR